MRILFLSPRQCWPPYGGAKLREYHFARALGTHADLTYAYLREAGQPAATEAELPFCRRIIAGPPPSRYTPWKLVKGLTGRIPLPVLNYTSPQMMAALETLRGETYNLLHLDSFHMAVYAPLLCRLFPKAPVVYNWHNIESEAMERYAQTVTSPARRWYAQATAGRMRDLERQILQEAYGHLVCSDRERAQILEIAPQARVVVIENGVDTREFAPANSEAAARTDVLFVGKMNYFPNRDAVLWFAREVWPAVFAQHPDLKLTVVGTDPGPDIRALDGQTGITVTGTVPDVKPYYERARLAIAPLRTGGGTRLKILEAMAAGVPVVSTPLGAEGLAVENGRDILLVEGADAWVAAISRLAGDAGSRRRIVASARRIAETHYDWRILGERLCEIYRQWVEGSR